ncbi:alpha/beta hydrolase [Tenggerimyces flavus]|uniref:Alpha/beta hydrolase n=1 Tax=Tenggerimyces flavus TaxID=1708749 RepID=A0ABV7YHA6_9ACTN|nr:alpha/beta hydrolase [Tenggerimyces flavus]MBM7790045.1 pimeloyl-ACP methyl ester carboxylesterase [Tenggerimyces flavus]
MRTYEQSRGRNGIAVALALALLTMAVACGTQDSDVAGPSPSASASEEVEASPTASSSPTPTTPPAGEERCSGYGEPVDAEPAYVHQDESRRLYALHAGTGTRGVVLIHGSGLRGLCVWYRELGWLPKEGFRVVAYDRDCVGASDCGDPTDGLADLNAIIADLTERGARDVVVVGASAGAPDVIVAAARPDSPLRGTVALSPFGLSQPPVSGEFETYEAAAREAKVPVLYVLAEDDTAATAGELRDLAAVTRPAGSKAIVLPAGTGHAQQVLYADAEQTAPSAFRTEFLTFLRTHTS